MLYFMVFLLILLLLLYLMPVTISIEVKRVKEDDNITIGVRTLYGLLKLKSEIPFLELILKNGRPAVKYKVEVADNKRSRLFARFTKLFSLTEGGDILRLLRAHKRRILSALKYIVMKTEVREFDLKFTLGTGDAASTGILYGAAWIVIGGIMSLTRSCMYISRPSIVVVPIFNKAELHVDFNCIIRMRTGHIINTGIRVIPVLISSMRKQNRN